jgi:hypothetical protein
MPAVLERALKRKVAKKGWSEERKDAYVYGTLRKTGWKPSTQKKKKEMSSKERILELNRKLDDLIQFQVTDADPTAGMFGGADPGIQQNLLAGDAKFGALQRLRLKLATLRGMGLHS